MAEENTQEMAMEDILSSIKNILEEDQASKQAVATNNVAEFAITTDDVDDVLELSQDMRLPNVDSLPQEINLDAELDDVRIPELNTAENSEAIVTNENLNISKEDLTSDPFFANDIEDNDNSISELLNDSEINFVEETVVPTNIVEPEEIKTEDFDTVIQETENIVQPTPTITNVIQPQEEVVVWDEPIVETNVIDNTATENFAAENSVTEVLEEDVTPEIVVPEVQEKLLAEEAVVENNDNDNAVDASANIISNFAKMFAKEEAAQQQLKPAPVENNINLLGDGSKTIEDVVCSVIRQIIADEVAANWQKSADYENFAKQEISSYTQKWIEKNLPAIVEKIVKQEIERVMAKAGNNQ